jgi:hypothetical protein
VPLEDIGPYPPHWQGRGLHKFFGHQADLLSLLMTTTVRITCPARGQTSREPSKSVNSSPSSKP